MPYFKGNDGYVLKVKARHLEDKDRSKGVSTITLTKYEYNGSTGYYINKLAFKS